MWHFISDTISSAINEVFICDSAKPIHRQHHHTSYLLKGSQRRFFVKICDNLDVIEQAPSPLFCEAEGLNALTDTQTIKCPKVICYGKFSEAHKHYEYLVLQYITFKSPSENLWQTAGQQLSALHNAPISLTLNGQEHQYGWHRNNFLGATQQFNTPSGNWADFYITQRIERFLSDIPKKENVVDNETLQIIHQVLSGHSPNPALLHGDLWHGNIGFCTSAPVIFDPAVWIGDAECDLAMAALFGGFAKSFFSTYCDLNAMPDGMALRRSIYQLSHALNHQVLFGDSYLEMSRSLVEAIKRSI
ncbi:fructosamine kinase family protein [Alteromonas facilis]|uniref:fructosamine kinase family protein n=1 Tax=Alteromonas facilis TaxID=2048004 RepID=UPI000C286FC3|nr:fructosamine kinase family protein [Alteromonas facilis]